jgi:hypothetical protein
VRPRQLALSIACDEAAIDRTGSDDCYTPPEVVDNVREALGGSIETDPCWSPLSYTEPDRGWTVSDDGLCQAWIGRVFVNPPYSRPHEWIRRAAEHTGPTVALVKGDPSTRWFRWIWTAPIVAFPTGRLRFRGEYAGGGPAAFPSAFAFWRCEPLRVLRAFGDWCELVEPIGGPRP